MVATLGVMTPAVGPQSTLVVVGAGRRTVASQCRAGPVSCLHDDGHDQDRQLSRENVAGRNAFAASFVSLGSVTCC